MQSFPQPLTAEEERYYLERYRGGDMAARNILIEKNLRLVAHIVKKYNNSGRDMDELIAIGIVGLVKAVNTFNVAKGNRIVTYAARCIENELLMMLRSERKLSREVSLYDPIGTDKEGNEINLLDIIETQEADVVEQIARDNNIRLLYENIDLLLSPREKEIICSRYGLGGHSPSTQREIADRLGISRSYVSRIEKKALEKLKSGMEP
ncbi:MAG TPA: RNA polymerase sporulation sigma factor SigK [Candidatus Scybalocola faecigallinarum]|uniref:RNA polymerase sporulation sigma factor SigK n=1 Tax=Candidatus Scybalocola faecigallinarum TaxID=2840941 RepID=A0A9D1F6L4_9FIRM|nr:RNA polymerase sporulation sigma factor SigK [Candidatus Scybalocola faecigallinarum]